MTTRSLLITLGIFAGCWVSVPAARAAILYTVPETQAVEPADTFTVDVRLNSENEIVNAVQARVLYDPAALEVVEVSKAGSFLMLWTEEPKVDSKAGVITFSGGTPNGSYVLNGRLVSIVFRSKLLGSTNILFDTGTSGVYRNDGLGTKVTLTAKPATIDVALTGRTLALQSSTHPDPDTWYDQSFLQVSWNTTNGALYAYILSEEPTVLPDTRFGATVGEAMYSNLKDGAYMFVLQEKLPNDTWSKPVRRRVLVDRQPPNPFTLQRTREVIPGKLALVFNATDATSGVVRYRVVEGDRVTESATSPFALHDQTGGTAVTVSAFDAAGNETQATLAADPNAIPERSWPLLPLGFGAVLVVMCAAAILLVRRRH